MKITSAVQQLADDARNLPYGTERQIAALNNFNVFVIRAVDRKAAGEFEDFCLHATDTEQVEEGLRLLALTGERA